MERAVVLGSSMAGLLVARVLTDHAGEVVVVERDVLPDGPDQRRGVPQGRHLHGLLGRGLAEIESLFPGITAEMGAAGGVVADPGVDLHWYVDGNRKPPSAIGNGIACTRPFLEWHVRRRLLALPGVRVVHARAEGLTATAGRVDGVMLSTAPADDGDGEVESPDPGADRLDADLVADCTGASTAMAAWLTALGYDPPPEQRVSVDLGYGTRFYRRGPDDRLDGALALISYTQDISRARGGGAFAVEDGRWVVTIGGYAHDRPTADPADFAARVTSEPIPALGRLIAEGEPLGDVATYRYPFSIRRDFHRLDRLPGGLVAAGDAVARFNPLYGQGMTSASLHAATLGRYLASGADPHEPAVGYFRDLRKAVDAVWQVSATEDFRLPHVTGDRPPALWAAHRVSSLYTRATLRDAEVHGWFLRVLNFQAGPESLLRPDHLLRALIASRRPLPAAPPAAPAAAP